MQLTLLKPEYSVCQLETEAPTPPWAKNGEFFAITRTTEELSIVCQSQLVPADVLAENGWRAVKVVGPLEFSMVGVLASLSATLAEASVSIFVISTYNTDYVLVKAAQLDDAITALLGAGHQIIQA